MNLAAQILPFLQLVLVGITTVEQSETNSLAGSPAFVLQFFAPSTLSCKAIEIAPETAAGIVHKIREIGEPVTYSSYRSRRSHDSRRPLYLNTRQFCACSTLLGSHNQEKNSVRLVWMAVLTHERDEVAQETGPQS